MVGWQVALSQVEMAGLGATRELPDGREVSSPEAREAVLRAVKKVRKSPPTWETLEERLSPFQGSNGGGGDVTQGSRPGLSAAAPSGLDGQAEEGFTPEVFADLIRRGERQGKVVGGNDGRRPEVGRRLLASWLRCAMKAGAARKLMARGRYDASCEYVDASDDLWARYGPGSGEEGAWDPELAAFAESVVGDDVEVTLDWLEGLVAGGNDGEGGTEFRAVKSRGEGE